MAKIESGSGKCIDVVRHEIPWVFVLEGGSVDVRTSGSWHVRIDPVQDASLVLE